MNNYDFVTKVLGMREKTAVQCASDWGAGTGEKEDENFYGGRES